MAKLQAASAIRYNYDECTLNGDTDKQNTILSLIDEAHEDPNALNALYALKHDCMEMQEDEHRDVSVNEMILTKMWCFLHPCCDRDIVRKSLIIVSHIAAMESTESVVPTRIAEQLLYQLSLLIVYDDHHVLDAVLESYCQLINEQHTDSNVIDMIIHSRAPDNVIASVYAKKNSQNILLIYGYLQRESREKPNTFSSDVVNMIFDYFGSYKNMQFDIRQRLMDLVVFEYYGNVRSNALKLLHHITRWGDRSLVHGIIYDQNLLATIKEILTDAQERPPDELEWCCWIIQNLCLEHVEALYVFDVIDPVINVIRQTRNHKVGIPVIYSVSKMKNHCNDAQLKAMIEESKLIENWEVFIDTIFAETEFNENVVNVLGDAFDIIRYLLSIEEFNIGRLCFDKVSAFWPTMKTKIKLYCETQNQQMKNTIELKLRSLDTSLFFTSSTYYE
eukprot:6159_1